MMSKITTNLRRGEGCGEEVTLTEPRDARKARRASGIEGLQNKDIGAGTRSSLGQQQPRFGDGASANAQPMNHGLREWWQPHLNGYGYNVWGDDFKASYW
jgi:hypothetical protein